MSGQEITFSFAQGKFLHTYDFISRIFAIRSTG